MRIHKNVPSRSATLALLTLLSACAGMSNPAGSKYDDVVVPGVTKLFDLSGGADAKASAQVYFASSTRSEMVMSFHDRLFAFQVDGVDLPGAKPGLNATGYQALALKPGLHTLSYCHTTRSNLGTGGVMCNFKIKDYLFEAGSRYMVDERVTVSHSGIGASTVETTDVQTNIVKLKPDVL